MKIFPTFLMALCFVPGGAFAGRGTSDGEYIKNMEQKIPEAHLNQNLAWNNPDTGNSGRIVVIEENRVCKKYVEQFIIDGVISDRSKTFCWRS